MKRLLGVILPLGIFVFLSSSAEAAILYIDPPRTDIHPGDSVAMSVRIDPDENECINVIDAVITYDPRIQPVDISRGQSIVPLWVEEPTIDTANNRITFAGGIPNGYCGRIEGDPRLTNRVLEIIFQAPGFQILSNADASDSPTSTVSFSAETSVLLNDNRGTKAELRTFGTDIFVHDKPGSELDNEWGRRVTADEQAPQQFSISLERDESIFDGKYFIVFNTTDKQTGIDHYEVIEEPLDSGNFFGWGAVTAPWVTSRSPHLLSDQTLNSTIRVKAVDKAGNEYIATLIPDEALRGTSVNDVVVKGIVGAGVLLIVIVGLAVWLYRRRMSEYEEYEYIEEYEEEVEE